MILGTNKKWMALLVSVCLLAWETVEAYSLIANSFAQSAECEQYNPAGRSDLTDEDVLVLRENYRKCQERAYSSSVSQGAANTLSQTSESDLNEEGDYNRKHKDGGNQGALLNTLLMFAVVAVALSMGFLCLSKSPSYLAGLAAAVIYVAGEINNMLTAKEAKKAAVDFYRDNDTQVAAFEAAAKSNDKAASSAEARSKMQKAAGAAWLAASGLAMGELAATLIAIASCGASTTIPSYGTTCVPVFKKTKVMWGKVLAPRSAQLCPATKPLIEAGQKLSLVCPYCVPATTMINLSYLCCMKRPPGTTVSSFWDGQTPDGDESLIASYLDVLGDEQKAQESGPHQWAIANIKEAETPLDAYANYLDWDRLMRGEVSSLSLSDYHKAKATTYDWSYYGDFVKSYLAKKVGQASSFIIPTAYAKKNKLLPLLGLVGGLFMAYLMIEKGVFQWAMTLVGSPTGRALVFGVFGTLALTVSKQSKRASENYRDNAKMYRAKANRLRQQGDPGALQNAALTQGSTSATSSLSAPAFGEFPSGGGQNCIVSASVNNPSGYDENCSCLQNNSCLRVPGAQEIEPILSNGNSSVAFSVPASLRAARSRAVSTANYLAQGNTEAARVGVSQLGQSVARIKRDNKKLQTKLNQLRKKAGQKPLLFDQAASKAVAKLKKGAQKSVKKNKATQALANFGPAGGLAKTASEGAERVLKSAGVSSKQIAGNGVLPNSPVTSSLDGFGGFGGDEGLVEKGDQNDLKNLGASGASGASGTLDALDFDVGGEEIHSEEGASLWEVISSRYLRSIPKLAPGRRKK